MDKIMILIFDFWLFLIYLIVGCGAFLIIQFIVYQLTGVSIYNFIMYHLIDKYIKR